MHWRQHDPNRRWQSHAVYAQGLPNPDARVRGTKKPYWKQHFEDAQSKADRVDKFPKQSLSDLKMLSSPADAKVRSRINNPSGESIPTKVGRFMDGNCPCCAAAFEMTARGYNVVARRRPDGATRPESEHMFIGGKYNEIWSSNRPKLLDMAKTLKGNALFPEYRKEYRKAQDNAADKTFKAIEKQGDGARGYISINYATPTMKLYGSNAGHVFNYVNDNGKVRFFDVQLDGKLCRKGLDAGEARRTIFHSIEPYVNLMRTDNLEPSEQIMNYIYSPDTEIKHELGDGFNDLLTTYLLHSGPVDSFDDAYRIICDTVKYKPVIRLKREYKNYYGFYMSLPGTEKYKSFYVGGMILVNKKNGKIVFEDDVEDELGEMIVSNDIVHSSDYLMHFGRPGQRKGEHKYGRWQRDTVYAQGRPDPDAKVRGKRDLKDAKERMRTTHNPGDWVESDAGRKLYSDQQFKDLRRLDGPPNFKTRMEINHPSNEKSGAGRHYNCPNCAAAFDMQERGYYTIARTSKNGSNVGDVEHMYKGGKLRNVASGVSNREMKSLGKLYNRQNYDRFDRKLTDYQMKTADNTVRAIERQGKGARGTIVVGWIDDPTFSDRTTSYHAFNYKNEKGGIKFYDMQSKKPKNIKGMSALSAKKDFFRDVDPREVYLMRTDNLEPTETIMKAVYSPPNRR